MVRMYASADEVCQRLQLSKYTGDKSEWQATVFGREADDWSWDIGRACLERVYDRVENDGP